MVCGAILLFSKIKCCLSLINDIVISYLKRATLWTLDLADKRRKNSLIHKPTVRRALCPSLTVPVITLVENIRSYLCLVLALKKVSSVAARYIQYQSKVWTHSRVVLFLYYCVHCRITRKTSKL
jgi:hypothetical protein